MHNYSKANLRQHGFKSRKTSSVGIKKCSPIDKKIILVKKYSRRSSSRKIETFCWTLDENKTGSQSFGHSKKIQNSISFKTFAIKSPFPTNSELRRERLGETGGKRNIEEGSHQKSSTIKRGVCKQLIPCKKERWGTKTSDKFEATECIYPILPLQNGRFAKSEIHVAKRRLHVQTRLKRCIFFSSLRKKFKAIYLHLLVRKLVRVPLPLLWFGTSTTNIHKIAKSANDNLTQDKHQNNNLLRRHAID